MIKPSTVLGLTHILQGDSNLHLPVESKKMQTRVSTLYQVPGFIVNKVKRLVEMGRTQKKGKKVVSFIKDFSKTASNAEPQHLRMLTLEMSGISDA